MAQQDIAPTDNGADSLTKIEANFTELYSDKLDTADFDTQLASEINSATSKTTPVDADELGLVDSAASNVLKKLTWANLKATILAYFTTVTTTWSNKTLTSPVINAITGTDHITITPGTSKLVKLAVLRQDNTTNTYKNNSVILTGWGFIAGDGANRTLTEAVAYGITFSECPITVISLCASRLAASGTPTSLEQCGAAVGLTRASSETPTTTGFAVRLSRASVDGADPGNLSSEINYVYNWIAVGVL